MGIVFLMLDILNPIYWLVKIFGQISQDEPISEFLPKVFQNGFNRVSFSGEILNFVA